MITVRAINARIKKMKLDAELFKGDGYFYFMGTDIDEGMDGVYVKSLSQLSVEQWMEELNDHLKVKK